MTSFPILIVILLISIEATKLSAWNETTSTSGCQTGDTEALSKAKFDQYTSLLNIYAWMRPTCEGIVRSVTFLNHATLDKKHFYLALFKEIDGYKASFRLINYYQVQLDSPLMAGWQTIQIPSNEGWKPPLRVDQNTSFGIFYETKSYYHRETVIPYAIRMVNRKDFPTYVGNLAILDVSRTQELDYAIDLDVEIHYRLPAFFVTISPKTDLLKSCGPPPTVPHAHVVNPPSMETLNPGDSIEYDPDEGYALLEHKFVRCEPDGIWSPLPYSAALPGYPHCPPPPDVKYATIIYQSYESNQWPENGAVAKYDCDEGYELLGKDYIRCNSASWTIGPTCQKTVTCGPAPSTPENAVIVEQKISEDLSRPGDFIHYACEKGSIFDGTVKISLCVALDDEQTETVDETGGQWSAVSPCVASCGRAPRVEHASVALQTFECKNSKVGSIVNYKCDSGYNISYPSGSSDVICDENGQWPDKSLLPQCTLDLDGKPLVLAVVRCGPAPELEHAVVDFQSFVGSESEVGSIVRYRCAEGFEQRSQSLEIICGGNGEWPYLMPICSLKEESTLTCGPPPTILNGVIEQQDFIGNNSIPGSIVQYRCLRGFNPFMYVPLEVQCGPDGLWPEELPLCLPSTQNDDSPALTVLSCRKLPVIQNAEITYRSFEENEAHEGDVIVFECHDGYKFVGNSTTLPILRCDGSEWLPKNAQCELIHSCGLVPLIGHAQIVQTIFQGGPGDMLRFECDKGYIFNGTVSTTVCENGRWTRVSPCIPSCGTPPKVPYAVVAETSFQGSRSMFRSTVRYHCRDGYHSNKEILIRCDRNGRWSSNVPVCSQLRPELEENGFLKSSIFTPQCQSPPVVKNGSIAQTSFNETAVDGDYVIYICDEGLVLVGDSEVVTCDGNKWSQAPTCQESCGYAPMVVHGYIIAATFDSELPRSIPGDSVSYTCESGFTLNDTNATIHCGVDKTWSSYPVCIAQRCSPPLPIEFGKIVAWSFKKDGIPINGDTVTYHCLPGYRLDKRPGVVKCEHGEWQELPKCVIASCGHPPVIDNAQVIAVTFKTSTSQLGDKAKYTCEPGYIFHGAFSIARCDPEKVAWVNIPRCVVSCGSAPKIANGYPYFQTFLNNDSVAGSFVRYRCGENYTLMSYEDHEDIICGPSGQWPLELLPVCRSKFGITDGVSMPLPQQMKPTSDETVEDLLDRDFGWHEVVPSSSKKIDQKLITKETDCENDDENDATIARRIESVKAELRSCYRLPQVENARIVDDGGFNKPTRSSKIGVVVQYECLPGSQFREKSPQNVVCRDDGWSILPTCFVISDEIANSSPCGRPPVIKNAILTKQLSDSEIVYQCENGYDLAPGSSNQVVTCLPSGFWSKQRPKCVWTFCGSAPIVEHAHIKSSSIIEGQLSAAAGDIVTYECERAFTFVDTNVTSTTCKHNGKWSQLPQCIPLQKPGVKKAPIHHQQGQTQVFSINSPCGPVPVIENGLPVQISDSSVIFDCFDGFTPNGLTRIVCASDNNWSEPPKCIPNVQSGSNVCDSPPALTNGFISERSLGIVSSYGGIRIRYSCYHGYTMDGPSEVTCLSNQWSTLPTCIRDETMTNCGEAPSIENAIVISKDFMGDASILGSKVIYRCLDKFVLSSGAKPYAICRHGGSWSQGPKCLPQKRDAVKEKNCSAVPSLNNGVIIYSSYSASEANNPTIGSVVIFECLRGYEFQSSSVIGGRINSYSLCSADAAWTAVSECAPVRHCMSLPAIENGKIKDRTFSGPFASVGDKISFECLRGFEISSLNPNAQCNYDGKWTNIPICLRKVITCDSLPEISDSLVLYKSFTDRSPPVEGSVVVFTCLPGYQLSGENTMKCSNGAWTTPPRCSRYEGACGSLPEIPNSEIVSKSFGLGSPVPGDLVRIKCKFGYVLDSANDHIVCTISGKWSHTPKCVTKVGTCGPIPQVQNAAVNFTTVEGDASVVGDVAWFQCHNDFEPVGSSAILCQQDLQWTPLPFCRFHNTSETCGIPPPINGGVLVGIVPTVSNVGIKVTYSCLPGHTMSGSRVITCQPGGKWTAVPICSKKLNDVSCGPVPVVLNSNEIDRNFVDEYSTPGSFVAISCQEPYYLQGPSRIECLAEGKWSSPLPRCAGRPSDGVSCGVAPVVANATPRSVSLPNGHETRSLIGDSIWWNCNDGFVMNGYPGTSCTPQGVWSTLPKCLPSLAHCPRSVSLIFMANLAETANFSLNDVEKLAKFIQEFGPNYWQAVAKHVNLTIAVVSLQNDTHDRKEMWEISPFNSAWLEVALTPSKQLRPDDLSRLFKTVRTAILPALPKTDLVKLVVLASPQPLSSFSLATNEVALLSEAKSGTEIFVIGLDGESKLQSLVSNADFLTDYENTEQFLATTLMEEPDFVKFMCGPY